MMGNLRLEWQLFLLAVQFLTRLPVPRDLPFSDDLLVRATKYYPLVGVLIGGIGACVLLVAARWLSMPVAVLLSMAVTVRATGAFHEDGLADAADGLGGGQTRERALEIMRDSRIGTYGAVTLGLALALKAALLMERTPADAAALLVAGHCLGRMAAVHVVRITRYARDQGAKFTVPSVTPDGYRTALGTSAAVALGMMVVIGGAAAVSALIVALVVTILFRRVFVRRLGGYTGDCLGATQQLAEIGIYLGAALWL